MQRIYTISYTVRSLRAKWYAVNVYKSCNYRDAYSYIWNVLASPASISVQFMFLLETRMWATLRACMWWSGNGIYHTIRISNQCMCMSHVQGVCTCVVYAMHKYWRGSACFNMLRNSRNVLVDNTTHTTVVFCAIIHSFSLTLLDISILHIATAHIPEKSHEAVRPTPWKSTCFPQFPVFSYTKPTNDPYINLVSNPGFH